MSSFKYFYNSKCQILWNSWQLKNANSSLIIDLTAWCLVSDCWLNPYCLLCQLGHSDCWKPFSAWVSLLTANSLDWPTSLGPFPPYFLLTSSFQNTVDSRKHSSFPILVQRPHMSNSHKETPQTIWHCPKILKIKSFLQLSIHEHTHVHLYIYIDIIVPSSCCVIGWF